MPHLLMGVGRRVNRPMTPRVLHDEKAAVRIDAQVVTSAPGTRPERQPVIELVTSIQRLTEFRYIAFPAKWDAQLLSNLARTSITSHEVRCLNAFRRTTLSAYQGGYSGIILLAVQKFCAIANANAGDPFGPRLQERFQRVLRDQLIGFKGPAAVTRRVNFLASLLDRGVLQTQQWRLGHGEYNVDVHRTVHGKTRGPYRVRQADAPIHFHRASVTTLHLREKLRLWFLLDEYTSYAPAPQIERQGQPHGTGADDNDLGIHS